MIALQEYFQHRDEQEALIDPEDKAMDRLYNANTPDAPELDVPEED